MLFKYTHIYTFLEQVKFNNLIVICINTFEENYNKEGSTHFKQYSP